MRGEDTAHPLIKKLINLNENKIERKFKSAAI